MANNSIYRFKLTSRLSLARKCEALSRSSPSTAPTTQTSPFSTSPVLGRKKGTVKKDSRITLIRYFLYHPLTPRPLRFSRLRALRHWTIMRAWRLYRSRERDFQERELERQYNSMREACEALRLMDEAGNDVTVAEAEAVAAGNQGDETSGVKVKSKRGKEIGRLYRVAMEKKDVWDNVPIEYARAQTDFPSREGWNHGWTR
ncbi:hypothetical protein M501DRAFT_994609 [Patellaria atrata CBS 101060]|uniref:Uncharacterized protein n=1 Tax=Patellaria atrata CBS 101060 TaxID=1346257 RepID=A0A9P4SKR4_9PEZI|nr:hypothetical protein M501DRAFT_994609 [Patellaria atrata CBS 101060]